MIINFDPIHQAQGMDNSQLLVRWIKSLSQIIRDPVYIACSADTMKINEIYNVRVYFHT